MTKVYHAMQMSGGILIGDVNNYTSRAWDFSQWTKPMRKRADPDEETINWRAVCGRTARTVRREGSAWKRRFSTPILMINYEFPPSRIHFEWCDGNDYDGGAGAIKYSISNSEFIVWLDTDASIKVNFSTNTSRYKKIVSLLRKELGNSVNV